MGDMGDFFRDWKEEKKENKRYNAFSSEQILIDKKIPYKRFTDDHFRVGEFDFWPATGLFIHIKTKKRSRGVFNLIRLLKEKL